jgi:hypothetical protein
MDVRKLLATLAASSSLTACCIRDSWWEDQTYVMPATADGQLGELIAKCRANDDCEPLCTYHWTYLSTSNPEGDSDVRNCERDGDKVTYEGYATCVAGRRPARFTPPRPRGSIVGSYLAGQAALEAASVRAFADLFADLVALGAPEHLRAAAIRAAADEVRHTHICRALAQRYDATSVIEPTAPAPRRSPRELALDNLVEGCVRESFGALVAAHQAQHAVDPAIRAAMHMIAADEALHALLALQIHDWLSPQLTASDRDLLAALEAHARAELAQPAHPDLVRIAGLPDLATQRELIAQLGR